MQPYHRARARFPRTGISGARAQGNERRGFLKLVDLSISRSLIAIFNRSENGGCVSNAQQKTKLPYLRRVNKIITDFATGDDHGQNN